MIEQDGKKPSGLPVVMLHLQTKDKDCKKQRSAGDGTFSTRVNCRFFLLTEIVMKQVNKINQYINTTGGGGGN